MKRLFIAGVIGLTLMVAASSLFSPVNGATASPTPKSPVEYEATIAALQTQVAALMPTQAVTVEPTTAHRKRRFKSGALGGDGAGLVPKGKGGVLDVVSIGSYDGFYLPIAIRNNSDAAMTRLTVAGKAIDSSGSVVAVAAASTLRPNVVAPGGIAIGNVFFGMDKLPTAVSFDLAASGKTSDAETSKDRISDFTIESAQLRAGKLIGQMKNPTTHELKPITTSMICFGEDGKLAGYFQASSFSDKVVPPHGETTFEVPFGLAVDCSHFLIATTGN